MIPGQHNGTPLPFRNAGDSPVRKATAHNTPWLVDRTGSSDRTGRARQDNNTDTDTDNEDSRRETNENVTERYAVPPGERERASTERARSFKGKAHNRANGDINSSGDIGPRPRPPWVSRSASEAISGQVGVGRSGDCRTSGGCEAAARSLSAAELSRRSEGPNAVDRGLAGVGDSLRSSRSSTLPPAPNGSNLGVGGVAVPALLSHVAELRSVCQRQREASRSLRGALVRKQGELDEASTETSWLRAEMGFVIGDMLGALQGNPTAGTIFGALSERIRSDLGAEAAAVYIDIGDGTLMLLPQRSATQCDSGDRNGSNAGSKGEVFVQRGVGVVGLVAMGAVPGANAQSATNGAGRGAPVGATGADSPDGNGDGDGVEVLLLNDGLEAFDNGMTVEAALLRAARGLPDGSAGDGSISGTVKNMLLARIGAGMASGLSRGRDPAVAASSGTLFSLPGPPTAVIQALNKQVAPQRFTEGDARAVRSLAPAVVAGSRLILSLLNNCARKDDGGGGGRQPLPWTESSVGHEEHLLREGMRRAREALGADRARIFVLSADIPSQLRLWHEEPPPRSRRAVASTTGLRKGAGERARMDADVGLHGLTLETGRAVRSGDALSDSLYDHELDLREGFLTRSVLCAPLLAIPRTDRNFQGPCVHRGGHLGVLQLAIGRSEAEEEGTGGGGGNGGVRDEPGPPNTRKKFFVEEDESLIETFAQEIAVLLSNLLDTGFQLRAPVTTLAGGGGHVDADGWIGGASSAAGPPLHTVDLGAVEKEPPADSNTRANGSITFSAPRWRENRGPMRVEDLEAQDSVGHQALASSRSTAEPSPPGARVRASVATAGPRSPPADAPLPPSPTTDGSKDGSPRGQDSTMRRGPTAAEIEAIQAASWTTAHRVLEVCKEGLAADKLLQCFAPTSAGLNGDARAVADAVNAERLAPAVCSLVSSLLPGCSAVLLLLDRESGRLRQAYHQRRQKDAHGSPRSPPSCSIRREDVARRALASGKALLAQAGEKPDTDRGTRGTQQVGASAARGVRSGARGDRVFCVPIWGSAGQAFGVLQLFLPPPPPSPAPPSLTPSIDAPGSPRRGSEQGRHVAPPPPASFFMAAKVMADCIGLALGWCEALDQEERDRVAAAAEFATMEKTSAEAHERTQKELSVKFERDKLEAATFFADQAADTANAHTRAVGSLLEGRETLAAAAAEVLARARHRRDMARVLAAWREVYKLRQKAQKNVSRMNGFRQEAAVRKWRTCVSLGKTGRQAEGRGAAAADRRGLQRAVSSWARAAARTRIVRERQLAGARLFAETWRKSGASRRCFHMWRAAARSMVSAQHVIERKRAEDDVLALNLAKEAIAAGERRWQDLAERFAEQAERRRQESVMRSACKSWSERTRRRRLLRDTAQRSAEWRRQCDLIHSLQRWRNALASTSDPTLEYGKDTMENKLISSSLPGSVTPALRGRETNLCPSQNTSNDYTAAERGPSGVVEKSLGAAASARRLDEADARFLRAMEAQRKKHTLAVLLSAWRLQTAVRRARKAALLRIVRGLRRRPLDRALVTWRVATAARPTVVDDGNTPENGPQFEGDDRARCVDGDAPISANSATVAPLSQMIVTSATDEDIVQPYQERLERLTDGLVTSFRRQRERRSARRVVAVWKRDTARERGKREVLKRLVRIRRRNVLTTIFRRWQEGARAIATAANREAATAAAAVAADAAATSAAAAKKTRAREEELKCARDTVAELQRAVEVLQSEIIASAAREQVADARLHESSERVSMAAGRAFFAGRRRQRAAQALKVLRNTAAMSKKSRTATAHMAAVHLSRCLRLWNGNAQSSKHRATITTAAALFTAERAMRTARTGARASLCMWKVTAERRRRCKRAMTTAGESLRSFRLRFAVRAWREVFRVQEASAAAEQRKTSLLARSRAQRALRTWSIVTFGERGREMRAGGGRVLVRLLGVAAKVEEAREQRRARAALQDWVGRVQRTKRLSKAEMRIKQATDRGGAQFALARWRAVTFTCGRLRWALERGATHAARRSLGIGWLSWRARVQQVAGRKETHTAITAVEDATTAHFTFAGDGDSDGEADEAQHPHCDIAVEQIHLLRNEACPSSPRGEAFSLVEQRTASTNPSLSLPPSPPVQGGGDVEPRCEVVPPRLSVREEPSSDNQGLLDLLVETCAAPPSYAFGSGLEALGDDACRAAVYTFGLLSASLFEVTGGPQGMAERVAAVQQGPDKRPRGDNGGIDGSASRGESVHELAEAEALCSEWALPVREPLGEGAVGLAAQSARPVCVEMIGPMGGGAFGVSANQRIPLAGRPTFPGVDSNAPASTVLCVPVMLQAALVPPMPSSAGLVDNRDGTEGGGGRKGRGPTKCNSVEVVGVLRAVRVGSGAFAGDDARALSAFCGQLALAIVAERALSDLRTGAAADAAKEARALRRQACRRVMRLFSDGAVAGALVHGKQQPHRDAAGARTAPLGMTKTVSGRSASDLLWGRVAGLAADALGCESVDLLQVAPLVRGVTSSGARLTDFLARISTSRSFRRASHSAPSAPCSGKSASREGSSRDRREDTGSWLCAPVVGAGDVGGDVAGDRGAGRNGGAALVCCAMNKGEGGSFDDVDEVLLGAIAAMYGVAASWMARPLEGVCCKDTTAPSGRRRSSSQDAGTSTSSVYPGADTAVVSSVPKTADEPNVTTRKGRSRGETADSTPELARVRLPAHPTRPDERDTGANAGGTSVRSPAAFCTARVNPSRASRVAELHDAATSPVFRRGDELSTGAAVMYVSDHRCDNSHQAPSVEEERDPLGIDTGVGGVRASRALEGRRGEGSSCRWRDGDGTNIDGNVAQSTATYLEQESGVLSHPAAASQALGGGDLSMRENESASRRPRPFHNSEEKSAALDAVEFATEGNAGLRKRADTAERMLEATKERLCRSLEGGAAHSAAAVAPAATVAAPAGARGAARDRGTSRGGAIPRRLSNEALSGSKSESKDNDRRHRTRTAVYVAAASTSLSRESTNTTSDDAHSAEFLVGYYSSDAGERRVQQRGRRRRPGVIGTEEDCSQPKELQRPRQRRTSSSVSAPRLKRLQHTHDYDDDDDGDGDVWGRRGDPRRRGVRRQRTQLRPNDLARMREVVARLRVATLELEAERVRRFVPGMQGGDRTGGQLPCTSNPVATATVGFNNLGGATYPGVGGRWVGGDAGAAPKRDGGIVVSGEDLCERRATAEAEASSLLRENASLRKKLRGLVALEELEGRAVRSGLLPLTGGGIGGGDLFPVL